MTDPLQNSDIGRRRRERAVGAVEQIRGVVAATVDLGQGTRIERIRIATGSEAAADVVQERAVSMLRDLGYDIDRDAVVVVPLGGDDTGAVSQQPAAAPSPRPQPAPIEFALAEGDVPVIENQGPPPAWHGRFLVLDGVDVRRSEARVVCTVRLKRLGELFSGEFQELDTPQGRARAAARAALHAAEQAGEGVGLSLEGVVIQEFFGRQYVMVFVDGISRRRHASLCGILHVEQSLETAAVLSVLRAVERWVAW